MVPPETSNSNRWLPIKPSAPVTKTFLLLKFLFMIFLNQKGIYLYQPELFSPNNVIFFLINFCPNSTLDKTSDIFFPAFLSTQKLLTHYMSLLMAIDMSLLLNNLEIMLLITYFYRSWISFAIIISASLKSR